MIGERLPVALDRSNGREIAIIVAILAILPLFPLSNYEFDIVTRLLIFVLFAVALNIIFGHTDQLFLFVGGLGAVGAYTTAILGVEIGITPWATLPIGVLFAGFIGATVSYVAARRNLTVILIAIFTLALQLAIIEISPALGRSPGAASACPSTGRASGAISRSTTCSC